MDTKLRILRELEEDEVRALIAKYLPDHKDDELVYSCVSATYKALQSLGRPSVAVNRVLWSIDATPPYAKPTQSDIDLLMAGIDEMCIPKIDVVDTKSEDEL